MPYPQVILKFRKNKRKKVIRVRQKNDSEEFPDLSSTFARIKAMDVTSPSSFLKRFVFDY